jgi:hypothetical protein
VYVILAGTRCSQLEQMREQQRVVTADLQLTRHEDQHGAVRDTHLDIFRQHGNVVGNGAEGLDISTITSF